MHTYRKGLERSSLDFSSQENYEIMKNTHTELNMPYITDVRKEF